MATELLNELVERRRVELGGDGEPLSYRALAALSHDTVSYETMRSIGQGKHSGRITDRIAEGLARALGVPQAQVYAAAQTPQPMTRWVLPERLHRLDAHQRRLVEKFASALLDAYDRGARDGAGE